MKKFIFSIFLIINSFAISSFIPSSMAGIANGANDFLKNCAQASSDDSTKNNEFLADSDKCFNAYDISYTSLGGGIVYPTSISTKTAGDDFIIKVTKKSSCNVNSVTLSLVDNETGNVIDGTTQTINNPATQNFVTFNIPNIYKNVSVKFEYPLSTTKLTNIGKCPSFKAMVDATTDIHGSGIFAVPTDYKCYTIKKSLISNMMGMMKITHNPIEVAQDKCNAAADIATDAAKFMNSFLSKFGFKSHTYFKVAIDWNCYEITTDTDNKTDYSTDNFAIKPKEFQITLKKSTIKRGRIEPIALNVVNYNDDLSTNYANDSTNLLVTFNPSDTDAQYEFNINNGKIEQSILSFSSTKNNVSMTITDEHYADVDSDDTLQTCRNIAGTSNNINIIGNSKYWAGTGTNEKENDPTIHTITCEIKQNVKKDLHFQKMNW